MKDKLKTIVCIMLSMLICGRAFTQVKPNPESDFKLIDKENTDGYYVYVGKSENVVIPKKIANDCLFNQLFTTSYTTVKIKSIVIPDEVTELRPYVFKNLSYLERVQLPKGLKSIGVGAFSGCSSLKEITIPSSITAIEESTFSGCSSLKEISFPSSVTSIGSYAFSGCSSLKEITIPPSITSIEELAFLDSGITNITISGNGLILNNLFTYNSRDTLRNNETNTVLKNVIISDGVIAIDKEAFRNCKALNSVTIPSTVNKIGIGAFAYCENLVNVSISEGVTSIGSSAFLECKNLTSIKLPSTITKLEGGAFYGCDKLVSFIIPNGITKIESKTFSRCKSLTNIDIPDSVTYIGEVAFCYCTSLANIVLPNKLTYIGDGAFSYCELLNYINIPSSVTHIDGNPFSMTSISSITLPEGIQEIDLYSKLPYLVSGTLVVPARFTNLGRNIWGEEIHFSDFKLVNKVILSEGVKQISREAFRNAENIETIIISDSVNSIDNGAFSYCKNLKTIVLGSGIKKIKNEWFKGCTSLEIIVIPDSVTEIEKLAFKDCPKVKRLTPKQYENINKTEYTEKTKKGKTSTVKIETKKDSNKSSSAKEKTSASKTSDKITTESSSVAKNSNKTPAKSSSAESKTEITTDNPFENSTIFTPHITKGEMDITTEPFEYNGQTYTALSISGNTGSQKGDYSDSWEASCKSNDQMKEFIQKGDNISFKALGDGKTWVLYFVLYDDDKATYYSYEFATKKGKVMEFSVPYKKLKFADWSVSRKFKKEEIRTIIFTGNNAGQKADRSIKIFDVKVF